MLLSTRVTRDAITSVPSSRGKPAPRLGLTAGLAGVAAGLTAVRFSAGFAVGGGALFLDGLVYNLPSLRLKDWPDLDGVVESRTRPIRLVIRLVRGVPVLGRRAAAPPPGGGSLAELRLLRPRAAVYRATFTASLVGRRLAVPLVVYGAVGRAAVALLFLGARPSSGRSRRSSGSWPGPYE